MVTSDKGLALIKASESCRLIAYPDPYSALGKACSALHKTGAEYQQVPKWQLLSPHPVTIGWGHTGPSVKLGDKVDQQGADALLRLDVHFAEYCLSGIEGLNQNQFDALVSLIFNIGQNSFLNSTLRKFLVLKDWDSAANQFLVWDHTSGQVSQGLLNRRKAERALFLTPAEEVL